MMQWNTEISSSKTSARPRLILVEAERGPCRDAFLESLLEPGAGSATWNLECDFHRGGPWAGAAELWRALVPSLEKRALDLMERHGPELLAVLPTLRHRLQDVPLTLTDTADHEEQVRNYPLDRAYRNVHGLIDLLAAWQERETHEHWTLVCRNFDQTGALGRRFFLELMRRRGAHLGLTLVLVGRPGAFADADVFADVDLPEGLHVERLRPELKSVPETVPTAKKMRARALEIESEVENDQHALAEHLPELIYHCLRGDLPEKALSWQGFAFATYNHLGFYEDALPYGEIVLENLDRLEKDTIFTRWNLVGALANCHLALRRPERALEIVLEEALPKIDDPTDKVRIAYVLALIYSRFLSKPDFAKAERHIFRGLEILDRGEVLGHHGVFLKVFTLNGLAFIRHRQGQPEEALELCRRGYKVLSEELPETMHRLHRSVLLYNSGQVHSAMRSTEEALESYSQAIEMDPNYSEYFNDRGNLYLAIGELDKAIENYEQAIRLSPPYQEVWTNLGQALKLKGLWQQAGEAYSRALDIDPRQVLPRLGRAQVYDTLDQGEAAYADYTAALALDPAQPLALANRAVLSYNAGRWDESKQDLDRALTLDPENPEFFFNRSVLLQDMEAFAEAAADLERYLVLLPEVEDRAKIEAKISGLKTMDSLPVAAG